MAKLLTPRVAIVGYGRHGKDVSAMALHNYGPFRFCGSTSWHALPYMAKILNLPHQVAWDTRHERRDLWKSYCDYLRKDDPLFLIKLALKSGNVVSGIRDGVEIDAAIEQKLFDGILWVERPGFDADKTVTFDKSKATAVAVNDGTIEELRAKVRGWAQAFIK
jgi:hypothetical protein